MLARVAAGGGSGQRSPDRGSLQSRTPYILTHLCGRQSLDCGPACSPPVEVGDDGGHLCRCQITGSSGAVSVSWPLQRSCCSSSCSCCCCCTPTIIVRAAGMWLCVPAGVVSKLQRVPQPFCHTTGGACLGQNQTQAVVGGPAEGVCVPLLPRLCLRLCLSTPRVIHHVCCRSANLRPYMLLEQDLSRNA